MESSSVLRTVSKNSLYNLLGSLWQFGIVLIGTRIAIGLIGAESFGLLSLVGGTAGYFLYMEMGIGETIVKKISEAKGFDEVSRAASTLFYFSAGLGLLLALLLTLFAVYGVELLFSFDKPLIESAARMFLVIASALWVLYPLNLFAKIFVGLQRMDIYNFLRVVFQTLMLVMVIIFLRYDSSAESAVAAITITGFLWKLTAWLTLKKLYPQIVISKKLVTRENLKEVTRYKTFAFIGQAAGHTINQCDIYIIGMILNPAAIALYSVANIISIKIAEVAGVFGAVIMPILSRFHGAGEMEKVRKGFEISTQGILLLLLPVTVFFCVYAETILRLWVGEEMIPATNAMRFLSIAWLLQAVSIMGGLTLKSINRPEREAGWAVSIAVSNVVLDFFFIAAYGMIGAVYATLLCQAVGLYGYIAVTCKNIGSGTTAIIFPLAKIGIAGLFFAPVYYLPLPMYLFFLKPVLHIALFWGSCYFLLADGGSKEQIKNIVEAAVRESRLAPRPRG